MKSGVYVSMVVDLDGTLIGKGQTVSARVLDAFVKLPDDLLVSIASGRPPDEVIAFAHQLGLGSPQICDGGATIWDPQSERPIWRSTALPPTHTQEIFATLDNLNLAFVATHPGGSITSIAQVTDWNLTRITAMELEERLADELVTQFSNPDLDVVKMFLPASGLWGVNFACAGVNKGVAAIKLAQMMGIELSRMIAVGDSYNDLPLLEVCGLRIAMGNAPEELKVVADFVAPSVDEDGLATAIEEFVLPRL